MVMKLTVSLPCGSVFSLLLSVLNNLDGLILLIITTLHRVVTPLLC